LTKGEREKGVLDAQSKKERGEKINLKKKRMERKGGQKERFPRVTRKCSGDILFDKSRKGKLEGR